MMTIKFIGGPFDGETNKVRVGIFGLPQQMQFPSRAELFRMPSEKEFSGKGIDILKRNKMRRHIYALNSNDGEYVYKGLE